MGKMKKGEEKVKGFLKSFRDFAMKGNVFDMAIGIIIGGAFTKIVSSLVADVLTPIIATVTGQTNFSDLKLVLKEGVGDAAPITINYGVFIQAVIDFLIIAFTIFMVVKAIEKIRAKLEAESIAEKQAKEEAEKAKEEEAKALIEKEKEEEKAIRRETLDLLRKLNEKN